MLRSLFIVCVLILHQHGFSAVSRQKRIVGGELARPPPLGASEAENVVENPAVVSVQPVRPPASKSRSATENTIENVDDDDGPIVVLKRGRREARVKGRKDQQGIYSFRGIRYAEPPVDSLRFQRPRWIKPFGDIDATAPGSPCPQTIGKRLIGSEDCLFLNVFSPEIPKDSASKKYPVIFWIHGGGFRRGSGSQYGVADLVKKGIVVVTIQYRLGSLGFLSTTRKELPGNAGLFDIVASLRWVCHYIQFFGGDPGHIISSGQGSGASAAIMLTLTRFTKSWVKGVFAMSGSAISSFAVDEEPARTAEEVSAIDECHNVNESLPFVRCMQILPLDKIVTGDDKLQDEKLAKGNPAESYITSISKLLNPGPAVEGQDDFRFLPNFLTGTPKEILENGDFAKVPLLIGVTKDETSTSAKGGGIATRLLGGVEATEELLESMIIQLFKVNKALFGNTQLNSLLNQLFSKNSSYLKGITKSFRGVAEAVDKIIEMTTDALFNLPAFLTSQYWSKYSKVYLYSFEYKTNTTTARAFLPDNPLTEQSGDNPVEGVGHGDDLVYLFDLNSIDGQRVENTKLINPKDLQVREDFITMVAEFVQSGVPKVEGNNVKPFTADEGDYIIVNSPPSTATDYRKCQKGIWVGVPKLVNSSQCSFLPLGDVVNNAAQLNPVTNIATELNNTVKFLPNLGSLGGSGSGTKISDGLFPALGK